MASAFRPMFVRLPGAFSTFGPPSQRLRRERGRKLRPSPPSVRLRSSTWASLVYGRRATSPRHLCTFGDKTCAAFVIADAQGGRSWQVRRVLSLGRHLLRKLGRAKAESPKPQSARDDQLPPVPSVAELRSLGMEAESETAKSRDEFAFALLAVDKAGSRELRQAAMTVLEQIDAGAWLALDVTARKGWWFAPAWSYALRSRLAECEATPLTLVLASFHPDGHIREAAVARMGELNDAVVASALALRCADWVDQVRARARLVVEQRLADPTGAALVAIGSIGTAMKARRQGTWLAELIQQQLRTGSDAKLATALKAGDWRVRRLAYAAAIERSRIGPPALLDAAMHDSDLPIRTRAAEAAVHLALAQDAFPELALLLASRTALVRAEAVDALGKAGDPKPAIAAIADPSALVRGTAQAVLRRSGASPADHYRPLVLANPPPPNALAGLGETGDNSDIAVLTRSLQHPLAKGRAAAVCALRMLGAATPDRVAHLLEDTSAAVTRQVAKALVGHSKELDRAFLERLVQLTRPRHVRVAGYRLLSPTTGGGTHEAA